MFGLYLLLNGAERFLVELMRVNISYKLSGGFQLTQAELIAVILMFIGLILMSLSKMIQKKSEI